MNPEQLKKRRDKAKSVAVLGKPKLMRKGYQLNVNIVKAENLPLLGAGTLDP